MVPYDCLVRRCLKSNRAPGRMWTPQGGCGYAGVLLNRVWRVIHQTAADARCRNAIPALMPDVARAIGNAGDCPGGAAHSNKKLTAE